MFGGLRGHPRVPSQSGVASQLDARDVLALQDQLHVKIELGTGVGPHQLGQSHKGLAARHELIEG